ncbi:MAG TPA: DUF2147 domain-containing protein [Bacteroidales bacterium]|nr:DUF2147 domain-containing protein [Bacteroidales bacterium]
MKIIVTSILLLFGIAFHLPAQQAADKITGTWTNEDGTVQNEIYKKGSTYESKIVKGKAYVGTVTMHSISFDGKEWQGKAYQPKTGRSANVSLKLTDENTLIIMASKAGVSKSKTWKRVNP